MLEEDDKISLMNEDYKTPEIKTLDDFFSYTQDISSIQQAGANALYGINQTKLQGPLPRSQDTQGFVFFTRPMLNLSKPNLLKVRSMHDLLSTDSKSVQRYVRCTLDPYLSTYSPERIMSELVDSKQAFIPLLTNTIIKLSGWPDVVAPTFTSKEGLRKEQWSIVDGTTEVNNTFDLDATFLNLADEPGVLLFKTWVNYQSYVFDGQMRPYHGMEAKNEIDYTTRIYRLVMDKSERFVKKIACTIASFPINEPTGKYFDYDRQQQYQDQAKEINIRFRSMGARYNDSIIVKWFNKAAYYANPDLKLVIESGFEPLTGHMYDKIPHELISKFKYRGYPLINTKTLELEWWIDSTTPTYKKIMGDYL